MYRSNSKHVEGGYDQQQQQQPGAYIDEDSDGEYMPGSMDDDMRVGAENTLPPLDFQEHLNRKTIKKAQTAILDIELVASPAELAQTSGSNVWRMMPTLSKQFKENLALRNRHVADEADLAGNLNRCVPLHLEILQQKNSFPYAMGIRIPGMLDTNLHKNGQCLWRVPAETPTMAVKADVFQPTNIVNKYMYDNYRMCTLEDLKSDITFVPKSKTRPAHANVQVGSLAHENLLDCLAQGAWQEELPHIEVEDIFEPGRNHTVQITEKMGRMLYANLEGPLKEAADAFIDLNNFNAEIIRADDHAAFDKPKGIVGAMVGNELVDTKKLSNSKLMTRQVFNVKARLTYLLF